MTAEAAMRLALAQARRASGRTAPNPAVGAVVFRGHQVLGRGSTRPPGGPHAEVVALRSATRRYGARRVRGASMAVTLEPCCTEGRTGPCTEEAIAAGLARVLIGHVDPHPRVSGRGVRRLRRAGIDVQVGVLERECREQHAGFLSVWERGRPFVTLKLAGTLDGRIATKRGESRWITGAAARAEVHRLRARVDGVLVGSGTALSDDPELTARRDGRVLHRPVRVLADTGLRVPADARLFAREGEAWVLCGTGAPASRRRAREKVGARLFPLPKGSGGLDLRRGLAVLARAGLTHLLVEGGGRIAASLLRGGLVDEVHWFVAPLLLGGDARPALDALAVRKLAAAHRLDDLQIRRLGDDVHLRGRIPGRTGRRKKSTGGSKARRARR